MTEIALYRTAVLREKIIAPLLRRITSPPFARSAYTTMMMVLEELGIREWKEYKAFGDPETTAAMTWVSIADVAYWAHQGQQCGYYEFDRFTEPFLEVAETIARDRYGIADSVKNLGGSRREEEVRVYARQDLISIFLSEIAGLVSTSFDYYDGTLHEHRTSQFQRDMTIADDSANSVVLKCIGMLVFASSNYWENQMSTLNQIADLMEVDPALSLPPEVMDAVSWAFTDDEVFENLDQTSKRSVASLTRVPASYFGYYLLESGNFDARETRGQRLTELTAWRERVARAAPFLTDDPAAAAVTGLRNALPTSPDRRQHINLADLFRPGDQRWRPFSP